MNNAIVCLTRGYEDMAQYASLIKRNNCIYEFFKDKYPLLIFHEGNITEEHQRYIDGESFCKDIEFIDISSVWSGGYEGMCRFNSVDVFRQCAKYDYIMRVDEDCHIIRLDVDPFKTIRDNVYLASTFWAESHTETNETLPAAIEELVPGSKREQFYNHKFPYTNVSVSSVKFWLMNPVYNALMHIAYSSAQRANRWGDLPVHGALLNIFAQGKVGTIQGLEYAHLSHDNIITS